jgi:broad specificity phosphatase PhoE
MWPKTVYIIRHAEKPEDPNDPNLSPQGVERALALAKNCEKLFGKLDCLFAAETSAGSSRSVDTINPLAQTIHLEIDSSVSNKDYSVLAAKLLAGATDYGGKTVLICWHHENIPELAQELRAANAPANWMGEVFDRIWVLEYQSSGDVYFQDLAQNLLQGDSKI